MTNKCINNLAVMESANIAIVMVCDAASSKLETELQFQNFLKQVCYVRIVGESEKCFAAGFIAPS